LGHGCTRRNTELWTRINAGERGIKKNWEV